MTNVNVDWDVDRYRNPHEPGHQWELRRKFMVQNKERFSEDRIVCLAQTFSNIEFMGCRYPKETMELVEELAFGVVQEYRESQKGRLKRTFVSGGDAAGAKVNRGKVTKFEGRVCYDPPSATRPPGRNESLFSEARGKGSGSELPDLLLVKLTYLQEQNPASILSQSAGFCKVNLNFEYELKRRAKHYCHVRIDGNVIATQGGSSRKDSRDRACNEALNLLEQRCYTILVKNKYLGDGTTVDATVLSGDRKSGEEALGHTNIGHKLLKLMGWSGGGLGKGGQGISEPVTAAAVTNRKGLGATKADQSFKQRVRKLVEEYATSTNPYDLVFTPDFSNEQRSVIHAVARRLGLRSKSHGKDSGRFLTISRKFSAEQLVQELRARGGTTEKYELLSPRLPSEAAKNII